MPQLLNVGRVYGHSLIEVLAALALASIGIIGFLHAQHLREATETDLLAHLHAVMLVNDIARKISANPEALTAYRTAYTTPPAFTTDCRRNTCSRNELAAFHVAQWKCRFGEWVRDATCLNTLKTRGLLPNGDGRIRLHGDTADIAVRWLDAQRSLQSFELRHALLRR